MKLSLLIAILYAACAAKAQTLRVVPVHLDATVPIPKTIQFFCTQDYDRHACANDSLALRYALASYPLERLGTWSFVLVPAGEWRNLRAGHPQWNYVSPAFSVIEMRTTVIDRSLFSATGDRGGELLKTYGVLGAALLDLAVTHELGHAICQDIDEKRADDYGRGLRDRRPIDCPRRGGRGTAKASR